MKSESEMLTLEAMLTGVAPFRSTAYYDKHLDAIRVEIENCSICEERQDSIVTLYRRNRPNNEGADAIVGFSIKGVRSLLHRLGLPETGTVNIAELITKLVAVYPDTATGLVADLYQEQKDSLPEGIEVPEAVAA